MRLGDALRVTLALATGALLCGCVRPTAQQKLTDFTGVWYGYTAEANQSDPADRLTVLNADGTFVSYFRVCRETISVSSGNRRTGEPEAGVAEFQTTIEAGHWSVAGDIQTIVTESVSGRLVEPGNGYIEQYSVARQGPNEFYLVSAKSRIKLDFHRVDVNFRLPPNPCKA